MEGFIDLQEELKEVGIRVVEIDHERTRSPDFIIVKEEKFLFNGDEFFSKINKPEKLGLSPAERNDIYIKFLEFVDKTWMYESISDVTPRQIGYNGSEWVLFDFYGSHSLPFHKPLLSIKSKNHVFESTEVAISSFEKSTVHWLPKKIEEEVKERISKIRKNQKKLKFFTRRETRMNRSLLIRKTVELLIPDHTKLEFNPLGIIKKTDFFGLGILAQVEIEIKSSIYINNKVSIYQAAFNGRSGRLFLLNRFESGDREKAQKYFNKQLNDTDHYVMSEDFIFVFDRS
ncbi:MAG: hypothetical protein H7328_07890 [Bdellovibrio sp.]|nr:hypothetical protein [Bdellovibrio sp.]